MLLSLSKFFLSLLFDNEANLFQRYAPRHHSLCCLYYSSCCLVSITNDCLQHRKWFILSRNSIRFLRPAVFENQAGSSLGDAGNFQLSSGEDTLETNNGILSGNGASEGSTGVLSIPVVSPALPQFNTQLPEPQFTYWSKAPKVASIVIPKYLSIIHAFSVQNNFSCLLTKNIKTLVRLVSQLKFHGLYNFSFGKRKHIMKTASLTRYTKRKSKNRTTNEIENRRRLSRKPGKVFSVCRLILVCAVECFLQYLFLFTGLYVA